MAPVGGEEGSGGGGAAGGVVAVGWDVVGGAAEGGDGDGLGIRAARRPGELGDGEGGGEGARGLVDVGGGVAGGGVPALAGLGPGAGAGIAEVPAVLGALVVGGLVDAARPGEGEAAPDGVVSTASKNTASGATPDVRCAVVIAAPDGGGLAATVIAADAVFDVSAALTPTTVYVPAVAGAV